MLNVGYVVLHYQTIDYTKSAIDSIKEKHGKGKANIVVVDNASPNGTGKNLAELYRDDSQVEVVLSDENVGFARGHNLGIEILRSKYNCEFIVLLNNDIELSSNNWDEIIINKFEQYRYGVLGPDVVSADFEKHGNPSMEQDLSLSGLRRMIRIKRLKYFLYSLFPISEKCENNIKKLIGYKSPAITFEKCESDRTNVQLQGSCLILSPEFFEYYNGLFDKTFLYFEEAILKYQCERKKLFCMYTPELTMVHKGGISVKIAEINKKENRLFYLKHSLNSCKALYNMVLKEKDDKR